MASSEWQLMQTADGHSYYYNAATDTTSTTLPSTGAGASASLGSAPSHVWVPCEREGYIAASVTSGPEPPLTFASLDGGPVRLPKSLRKAGLDAFIPLDPATLDTTRDDLVQMGAIDEGIILHNLRKRFFADEIYTNIGPILIVVNPYRWLKLYSKEIMDSVAARNVTDATKPHIFNIADDAFRALSEGIASGGDGANQSILISGESGAGKTEATKQALKYLAYSAGSGGEDGVEQKLLAANPLLEAFGNAATLRNHNSSRFGKWMEVFFDTRRSIVGARINNYLLEKSRVSHQIDGERNFHIFYHLTKDPGMSRAFNLGAPEDYAFINKRITIDDPHFSDAKDFAEVLHAMDLFNITDDNGDRTAVFRIVAAILHFGNLRFGPDPGEAGEDASVILNPETLELAADLLSVSGADLARAVLYRTLVVRGQTDVRVPLSPAAAADNRNALARTIYNCLFNWLVARVNQVLAPAAPTSSLYLIGILDIFGFEIFENNSFEQLCINFANEKLQQHFNQHTFKMEQALYMAEGVPFDEIKFIDNQPCLDLLEHKPHGILIMLDEELLAPSGSDMRFLDKANSRHAKADDPASARYSTAFKTPHTFNINHYAGQVTYDVRGFLEKNKDTIELDLLNLVHGSSDPFITALFDTAVNASSKSRKHSVAHQFRAQLNSLMSNLQATTPHYVRCIKPNSVFTPQVFDGHESLLQLRYSGVFEAVRIRQTGYPFRYRHEEFVRRYGVFNGFSSAGSPKATCKAILAAVKGDFSAVQLGRTRVLYRAPQHHALEVRLSIITNRMATRVQAAFRGFRARRLYARMKEVAADLRAAMATLDVDTLKAAVDRARSLWFQLALTDEAERVCNRLLEERSLNARMETLVAAGDPEGNYEAILAVTTRARELGVINPHIDMLAASIASIHERKVALANLVRGTAEYDRAALEEGLEAVGRLGLSPSASVMNAAHAALAELDAEDAAVAEAEGALVSPQDDLEAVQAALAGLAAVVVRTAKGKSVKAQLSATLGIRVALRDQDWAGLEAAVASAVSLGLSESGDVQAAQRGLALREEMAAVGAKLVPAMASKDLDVLGGVLGEASALDMATSLYSDWRDVVAQAEAQAANHRALLDALAGHLAPLAPTTPRARAVLELKTTLGAAEAFGFVTRSDKAVEFAAATLLGVRDALDSRDWAGLTRAVRASDTSEALAQHPEIKSAKEGLALRAKMDAVAGALTTAMSARSLVGVENALADADALDMTNSFWSSHEELVARGHVHAASHKRVLKNLKACTGPGTSLQIDSLSAALADAKVFGLRSAEDTALVRKGELLLSLRSALKARDWDDLAGCVARADAQSITSPEVNEVRAGLATRAEMAQIAGELRVAAGAHDSEALREAMSAAKRLDMVDSFWSTWSKQVVSADAQLRKHLELLRALRATLAPGTAKLIDQLQSVLNNVAAFGFKTSSDVALEKAGRITLDLRKAIAGRDWDGIAAAVSEGSVQGLGDSGEFASAAAGLETRSEMGLVAQRLGQAAQGHDATGMTRGLADADKLDMSSSYWSTWSELVTRTTAQLSRHKAILAALRSSTAPGTATLIEPLEDALEDASEYGMKTEGDCDLVRGAQITLQARIAFASRDWDSLRKATQAAFVGGHESSELRELSEGLKLRGQMTTVAASVRAGMEARDADALEAALLDAGKLRMESSPWSTWKELLETGRKHLQEHRDLLAAVRGWMGPGKSGVVEPLQEALSAAAGFGYSKPEDTQVLALATILVQMRKAFLVREYTQVRSQVRRAKQIGVADHAEVVEAEAVLAARDTMESTAKRLNAAASAHDAAALREALLAARACEMGSSPHSSWVEDVEAAKTLLAEHRALLMRLRAASGPQARFSVESLSQILQDAINFGLWVAGDAALQNEAAILLRARQAFAAQSWGGLKAALDSALVAGLDNAEVRWYRDGLAERERMDVVARELKRGVEVRDLAKLTTGLGSAAELDMEFGVWSTWGELVVESRTTLADGEALLGQLKASMTSSLASHEAHEALLGRADGFGFRLQEDLDVVRGSRMYMTIRRAVASCDWATLETTLRSALAFGMESEELATAAETLHLARQRAEMAALLKSAMQDVYNYDRNVLGLALEQAAALDLANSEYALLEEEAKKLAGQIEEVRTGLATGTEQVSRATLESALELASDIGYETVEVASARVLLHEIKSIEEGAAAALAARDVKVIQQLLRRAKMIKLVAEPVPEMEIKLPLFVYSEGDLQVKDYAGLREASSFASKKWFGKAAAAQSMLVWTSSPLPNSLMALQTKEQVKIAMQAFTQLLAFMGDRKSGGMFSSKNAGSEKHMRFLVELGRGNSGNTLADELYVQLVKQLSSGSDGAGSHGVEHGWALFEAYAGTFLPSEAFYPYVEWWVVTHAGGSGVGGGLGERGKKIMQLLRGLRGGAGPSSQSL